MPSSTPVATMAHPSRPQALLLPRVPVAFALALATALVTALGLVLVLATALPALAHGADDDHNHGMDDADFADPVIWDGTAQIDCAAAGQGTMVWTLTGSTGVEYAELHIDEPVRSVTSRNAPPYVWVSPLYALAEIEADADRIVGDLAATARLDVVYCLEGGSSADTGTLVAGVGGGAAAGAVLGLLIGRRRRGAAL